MAVVEEEAETDENYLTSRKHCESTKFSVRPSRLGLGTVFTTVSPVGSWGFVRSFYDGGSQCAHHRLRPFDPADPLFTFCF